MCALYRPFWNSNGAAVADVDARVFASASADLLVLRASDRSLAGSPNTIGALIGQRFSAALAEELQSRGLVAQQVVMRSLTSTQELSGGANRIRVELHVTLDVPKATTKDLIDALTITRRKCAVRSGESVKILLRADLKATADFLGKAPYSLGDPPEPSQTGVRPEPSAAKRSV